MSSHVISSVLLCVYKKMISRAVVLCSCGAGAVQFKISVPKCVLLDEEEGKLVATFA